MRPSHRSRHTHGDGARISQRPAAFLTDEEIELLDARFLRAFEAVEELRREASVGRALRAVTVPPRAAARARAAALHLRGCAERADQRRLHLGYTAAAWPNWVRRRHPRNPG